MKSKATAWALAMIVVHTGVSFVHGNAHEHLAIGLTNFQQAFVAIFVLILPLVAAVLLFTRWRRVAGALLAVSMAADFFFGIYNHFLVAGPDNFFETSAAGWGGAFRWTVLLLAVTEALGCWAGIRVCRESPRTQLSSDGSA
jgi:glucan phosphoethanolaminetransferase (alkaline phosphatase superfamily)